MDSENIILVKKLKGNSVLKLKGSTFFHRDWYDGQTSIAFVLKTFFIKQNFVTKCD